MSESEQNQIRIGYACLNTSLRDDNVFTSRTLTLKTAADKGIEYIKQLAIDNVNDLMTILIYNEAHGIRFYRMSSCIFPHQGNPRLFDKVGTNYDLSFVKKELRNIGDYAKKYRHRLTMHPGQYVQLASPNKDVVTQSIIELENHVELLETMRLKPSDGSVLIIQGGGRYDDKQQSLQRWKETFLSMPKRVRDYISLENDEISYGIMDLLPLCEQLNIPFCLDVFHNRISNDRVPITKRLLKRIFMTWHNRGIIPKIHVSEQQENLRRGAHSKTLDRLPIYLLQLPTMLNSSLDIMLEVKDKEKSVFKIYHKYFNINMDKTGKVYYTLK